MLKKIQDFLDKFDQSDKQALPVEFKTAGSEDYHKFIQKLNVTAEQIKSGDLEHVAGIACDPRTHNIIVPPELLAEQGNLLLNYVRHSENRPKESDIPDETLKKLLFDAAFKVKDSLTGSNPLHEAVRESNKRVASIMIKEANPEQLFIKNAIGANALDLAFGGIESYSNEERIGRLAIIEAIAEKGKVEDLEPYRNKAAPKNTDLNTQEVLRYYPVGSILDTRNDVPAQSTNIDTAKTKAALEMLIPGSTQTESPVDKTPAVHKTK